MNETLSRRRLLACAIGASLASQATWARGERLRRILVRSSWQTVNIGDIAHTPGLLHLLEEHLPDAEVRLWPSSIADGVEDLLRARFPKLGIVKGADALRAAFHECDFLLHGSGSGFVAQKDVARWRKETGKPYGVYGISFFSTNPGGIDLLSHARFAFFRETVSLQFAKDNAVRCPVMGFAPDAAFATDLRDDAAAEAFLREHGLEPGKFLCVIPRFRKTPYWEIRNKPMTDVDRESQALNDRMREHDHAPIRAAVEAVARQTDLKLLVCPEDQSQVRLGKQLLVDPLPDDVRKKVVWRDRYWLTPEAVSTYVRSAGLFGLEMHSPIMCVGHGVPAIVCRFKEQTSKGFMWRDIGLGDWLFDMDAADEVARIVPAVLALAKAPAAAKAKAAKAREVVLQRQRETMAEVNRATRVA